MTICSESRRFTVSNSVLAASVYVVFGVTTCISLFYSQNFLIGLAPLIGVIIAHVKADSETDPVLRSHYRFQIGTFWIGLLLLAAGILLYAVIVGAFIFLFFLVWSLVRNIKGLIAINEGKPIANPTSWLFG